VRSLLIGTPIEKLKPDPRQQSASHSKRKFADHKLEEKEGSTGSVGRRSSDCYVKRREQQSREASYAVAKKVLFYAVSR
jgi:hypothetical protein